jgi:hypothetical protein
MKKIITAFAIAAGFSCASVAETAADSLYFAGTSVDAVLKNDLRAYALPTGGPMLGEIQLKDKINIKGNEFVCVIPMASLASLATERVSMAGAIVICQHGLQTVEFRKRTSVIGQDQVTNAKGRVGRDEKLGPFVELDGGTKLKVVFLD